MTALLTCTLECDAPGCDAAFCADVADDSLTRVKAAAYGWTSKRDLVESVFVRVDFCKEHSK